MKVLTVAASRSYDIVIQSGLLLACGEQIRTVSSAKTAAILTDDIVAPLYLERVSESLQKSGFAVCVHIVKNGESAKDLASAAEIYEFLTQNNVTRTDIIVALGGGVVGDLAGFIASTYLRGIPFVQIPTTLLAAIDSSIGGKTAVNIASGKNLVGSFYQPVRVLCDTLTLLTLSPETVSDGLAEAIKYGAIADSKLFYTLRERGADLSQPELIYSCAAIKRDIVQRDERDTGERMTLNFGHTVGHALEKLSGYTLSHGKAIAIGMAVITRGAEKLGLTASGTAREIEQALKACCLPHQTEYNAEEIALACFSDKKWDAEHISIVLLHKIGSCYLKKMSLPELSALIKEGMSA